MFYEAIESYPAQHQGNGNSTDAVVLVSEIMERFEELDHRAPGQDIQLMRILCNIYTKSPPAYASVREILSGSGTLLSKSFTELAQAKNCATKQNYQQYYEKQLALIKDSHPAIYQILREVRRMTAKKKNKKYLNGSSKSADRKIKFGKNFRKTEGRHGALVTSKTL